VDWHACNLKEIYQKFDSSPNGLSAKTAKEKLSFYGPNQIIFQRKISPFLIFTNQFKSFLVLVLIIAAAISYFAPLATGENPHLLDTILILSIVIFNAIFGFLQDYQAEKSIEALKKITPLKARVVRNGIQTEIDASQIVPGDILFLFPGQKVPADSRIIISQNLACDESILTGESLPVGKNEKVLKGKTPLAERSNLLFTNTLIVRGKGQAIVFATGKNTEFGKIAREIEEAPEKITPFQLEINTLGKKLAMGIMIIIVIFFLIQLASQKIGLTQALLTSISLAVAAIPEGLPAVVTLSLALGTRKMLVQKSLVKRLAATESLGSVDVICTDKTGTLTENRMTLQEIYFTNRRFYVTGLGFETEGKFLANDKVVKPQILTPLLESFLLCNNATFGTDEGGNPTFLGDPTETAILVCGLKGKIDISNFLRVEEIPFTSQRKMMAVIVKKDTELFSFVKGAPEMVIAKCNQIYQDKIIPLTKEKQKAILAENEVMAHKAQRVLAFAFRPLKSQNIKEAEKNLIFLGLCAMIDPPRHEVYQAVKTCQNAGIRVVMITGDNKITALAIAKTIGLGTRAIEAKAIENLSQEKLRIIVEKFDIFARAAPLDKVKILAALQKNGHVVAMTGDGINDAPALKNADVGIAMGVRGTDLTKQASDLVILDDNFSTIVEAVRQGRTIFKNIRNFVNYLLTTNFAEVATIFILSLFGFLALRPAQILWINLLTDGLPALALGADPPRPQTMNEKPRPKSEGMINAHLGALIVAIGLKITIILVLVFMIGLSRGLPTAQTMLFTGFILFQFVRISIIRSQENLTLFSNKGLVAALLFSLVLQLFVLYSFLIFPPLNIFGVAFLGLFEWFILLASIGLGWILALVVTKAVGKVIAPKT